jgi:hypothetical protein
MDQGAPTMSVDKTERRILRDLENARNAVKEYEMFRGLSVAGVVFGLIVLAVGIVFFTITDRGGFIAMIFCGFLFVFGGIAGFFCNRESAFYESAGPYSKRRVQGPYMDLRDAEDEYEDYLDRKSAA